MRYLRRFDIICEACGIYLSCGLDGINEIWGLAVGLCRKLSKRAAAEVKKTQKCLLLHTHSAYDDL